MNTIPKVTWAITVCNEIKELTQLLNLLHRYMNGADEVLIQYDSGNVSREVLDYLNIIKDIYQANHKVVAFPLNNDFGEFKNNLKREASGLFIFNIDADELPHQNLIENIHEILDMNKEVDVFMVPRINTVDGITKDHIQKWSWKVRKLETQVTKKVMKIDSPEFNLIKELDLIISMEPVASSDYLVDLEYYTPVINFPDIQTRLYRRLSEVQWDGKVHEKIVGYNLISVFPMDEEYCLYHHKDIYRQEKQNQFYETI